MNKLKPCPFCGGEAYGRWRELTVMHHVNPQHIGQIQCIECNYILEAGTLSVAMKLWNTRAECPRCKEVDDFMIEMNKAGFKEVFGSGPSYADLKKHVAELQEELRKHTKVLGSLPLSTQDEIVERLMKLDIVTPEVIEIFNIKGRGEVVVVKEGNYRVGQIVHINGKDRTVTGVEMNDIDTTKGLVLRPEAEGGK